MRRLRNSPSKIQAGYFPAAFFLVLLQGSQISATAQTDTGVQFPRALETYIVHEAAGLSATLLNRIQAEPFNLIAAIIFFCAIAHTFLAPFFTKLSHQIEQEHRVKIEKEGRTAKAKPQVDSKDDVSFKAEILHFFGEVEAIFGIWVVPLLIAIVCYKGWPAAKGYLNHGLNFTEPIFVVVIMTMAASRPVLRLAEAVLAAFARIGKGSAGAWWLSILTLGPLLGS